MPRMLEDIATDARRIIDSAVSDGLTINNSNVVDLLADNLPDDISLSDIRAALVISGYGKLFSKACYK